MSTIAERLFFAPPTQAAATRLGLPKPEELHRGRHRLPGPVAVATLAGSSLAKETLASLDVATIEALRDGGDELPAYGPSLAALIVDACGLRELHQLEQVRAAVRPALSALSPSARIVLIADADPTGVEAQAVRQALDGINRTIGKELRHGATSNLIYVDAKTGADDLASTLAFLLEGRSAFVDGQSWTVHHRRPAPSVTDTPLADRIVVVTGAARGIGAQIVSVAARDGAQVICIDVPAAGEGLAHTANQAGGTALQLDITAADAGERIAAHVTTRYGNDARIYAMVHNAGITRDKLLIHTDASRWAQVIDVNLAAQLRINPVLLDGRRGGLAENGRIVSIASTSGIAGNRGQANYAASKAGVVGLVRSLALELTDRGITVNAVAPGFIETEMTAKIPFVQREIFRRTNSLSQGGQPIDVAETIGYFLDPASTGVTGQVMRVCGQNLVGA